MQGLLEKVPVVIGHIQTISDSIVNALIQRGIEIDPTILSTTLSAHLTNIISSLVKTVGQIGRTIGGIIILLYNLVFIPLSAYLFLYDRGKMHAWFRSLFAAKDRDQIDEFIQRLNVSLARFFRGSLLMMLVVGCIIGVALYVLGIKYYLFLGIIAGLCNIVPNIGFILSFIPAIVIGSLSPAPLVTIVKICGVYIGEQLLENLLLGPIIIGKASKLHPVVVMIVLVLGGALFGVWGVIIAVPVTLFMREFLNYFLGLNL
jgi:predicted PurR-regulated permease PerM